MVMFQKTRKRVEEEEEENCPLGLLACLPPSLRPLPPARVGSVGRVGVGAERSRAEVGAEEGILFPTDRSLFRVQKSREGGEREREGERGR